MKMRMYFALSRYYSYDLHCQDLERFDSLGSELSERYRACHGMGKIMTWYDMERVYIEA